MPQQVAVAFQVILRSKIEIDDFETTIPKPIDKELHLALPRLVHHLAGNHKSSYAVMKSHENLVCREDHVFQSGDWINRFDCASCALQRRLHCLPLPPGLRTIDRRLARHVGIFLVDNVEKLRGTEQNSLSHFSNGSDREEVLASGSTE